MTHDDLSYNNDDDDADDDSSDVNDDYHFISSQCIWLCNIPIGIYLKRSVV